MQKKFLENRRSYKKILGVTLIAFVFVLSAFAMMATPVEADDTCPDCLVSYWKLDETSGDTAYDEEINNNHGILFDDDPGNTDGNDLPDWENGQVNGALEFDGVDDYVAVPDDPSLDITDTLTLECWFNVDNIPNPNHGFSMQTLVSKDTNYEIHVHNGGTLYWWWEDSSFNEHYMYGTTTIQTGTWYHVAVVYNQPDNSAKMFLNGVLENEMTVNNNLATNNLDVHFGKNHHDMDRFFGGKIDEVALYDCAISENDVREHYLNGLIDLGICEMDQTPPTLDYAIFTDDHFAPNWYDQGVDDYATMEVGWTEEHPDYVKIMVDGIGTFTDNTPTGGVSTFEIPIAGEADGDYTISYEIRDLVEQTDTDVSGTDDEPLRLDDTGPVQSVEFGDPQESYSDENGDFPVIGPFTPIIISSDDGGVGSEYLEYYIQYGEEFGQWFETSIPLTTVYDNDITGDPFTTDINPEDGIIEVKIFEDESCWHEIHYWCYDFLGNRQPAGEHFKDFIVDADAPEFTVEFSGPSFDNHLWMGPCTQKWINVTDVGCTDVVTGANHVDWYIYRITGPDSFVLYQEGTVTDWDGSGETPEGKLVDHNPVDGEINFWINVDEDCKHYICWRTYDDMGNYDVDLGISTPNKQLHKVDVTAPQTSIEIDGCTYESDNGMHISLDATISMDVLNDGQSPCIYPNYWGAFRIYREETDTWYPSAGNLVYAGYGSDDVWEFDYDDDGTKEMYYKYDETRPIYFTEECHHILEFFGKDPLCNTEDKKVRHFYVDDGIPYADLIIDGHGYYPDDVSGKNFIKAGKEFTINGYDLPDNDCAAGIEYVFWRYDFDGDSYPLSAGTGVITGAELASLYDYEDTDIIGHDWFIVPGDTATVKFDEKCQHHLYYFVKDRVCHHSPVYDKLFYVDEENPTTDGYQYPDHGYVPANDDGPGSSVFYLKEDTSIFLQGDDLLDGDCSAGIEAIFFRYKWDEKAYPENGNIYGYDVVTGAELASMYEYTNPDVINHDWFKVPADTAEVFFENQCTHYLSWFIKDNVCHRSDIVDYKIYVDATEPDTWLDIPNEHGFYVDDLDVKHIKENFGFTIYAQDIHQCASGIESIFFRYDWDDDSYPINVGDSKYGATAIDGADLVTDYGADYDIPEITDYIWYRIDGVENIEIWFEEQCEHTLFWFVKDNVCHRTDIYDETFEVDTTCPTSDWSGSGHGIYYDNDKVILKEGKHITLNAYDTHECTAGIESIFWRWEDIGQYSYPGYGDTHGFPTMEGSEIVNQYGDDYDISKIRDYKWYKIDEETADVWFDENCQHNLIWFVKDNVCHRSDIYEQLFYVDAEIPTVSINWPSELHGYYTDDELNNHIKLGKDLTISAQDFPETECMAGIESIFFRYDWDNGDGTQSYPLNVGDSKYGATAIDGNDLVTQYGSDYDISAITDYLWYRIDNVDQVDIWFDEECMHTLHFFAKDNVCHKSSIKTKDYYVDGTGPELEFTYPDHGYYPIDDNKGFLKVNTGITVDASDLPDNDCMTGIESIFWRYEYDSGFYPVDDTCGVSGQTIVDLYGDQYDIPEITDFYWYRVDDDTVTISFEEQCQHDVFIFAKDNVCNRGDIIEKTYYVDETEPETWLYLNGHGYYQNCPEIDGGDQTLGGNPSVGSQMCTNHLKAGKHFSINATDNHECAAGIESIFFRYKWDNGDGIDSYPLNIGDTKYGATAIDGATLEEDYGYTNTDITDYIWYRIDDVNNIEIWFEEQCEHELIWFAKDNVCQRTMIYHAYFYVDDTNPTATFEWPESGHYYDDVLDKNYLRCSAEVEINPDDTHPCSAGIESTFWRYEFEGVSYPNTEDNPHGYETVTGDELIAMYGESYNIPEIQPYMWYRIDGDESVAAYFFENCTHNLTYFVKDNVCHHSDIYTQKIFVDCAPPESEKTFNGPTYPKDLDENGIIEGEAEENYYITADTEITISAIDYIEPCASGIAGFHVTVEWDTDCDGVVDETLFDGDVGDPYTYTFTIRDINNPDGGNILDYFSYCRDGLYKITWYSIDNVGNEEQVREQEHIVDDTPPHVVILKPTNGWYSDGETIPSVVLAEDLPNPHCCMFGGEPVGIEDGSEGKAWIIDIFPEFRIIELETENFLYDADSHEFVGNVKIPENTGINGTCLFVAGAADRLGNNWTSLHELLHIYITQAIGECEDECCVVDTLKDILADFIADQNIVFVGIDNIPPEVNIIEPEENENVGLGPITIQADIEDTLSGVVSGTPCYVKLDDINIGTLFFDSSIGGCKGTISSLPWSILAGEHDLKVTVADRAGCIGSDSQTIIVGQRPGPATSAVDVQPDPSMITIEGEGETLNVTGQVHSLGEPVVTNAEYFISDTMPTTAMYGTGTPLIPSSGHSWGTTMVDIEAEFNTDGWDADTYTIWVHGQDEYGRWGAFDEEEFNVVLETNWRPIYCEIVSPEEDEVFTVDDCEDRYVEVEVDVHYWDDWTYSDMSGLIGNVNVWLDSPYGAPDQYYDVEYNRYGNHHFWADIPVYMYSSESALDLEVKAWDQYGNKEYDDTIFEVITTVVYDQWMEKEWNKLEIPYNAIGCDDSVEHVLSSIDNGNFDLVVYYDEVADDWDIYVYGEEHNDLEIIEPGKTYWVHIAGEPMRFYTDTHAPFVNIDYPVEGEECVIDDISGTACDIETSVESVKITIFDEDTSQYWDGEYWVEDYTELDVDGTEIWSYDTDLIDFSGRSGHKFIVTAYATDIGSGCTSSDSTFFFYYIPEFTNLDLIKSTDEENWEEVTKLCDYDFTMCLDSMYDYYYIDLDNEVTSTNVDLAEGDYGFYLDTTRLPDGFYTYWENKGVYDGCTGTWQPTMWEIISGNEPMFFLNVDSEQAMMLLDGLQYLLGDMDEHLRVNGDYPNGEYYFTGTVIGTCGEIESELITIKMVFTECNQPPNVPYDPNPGDEAIVDMTEAIISWYGGDPDEGDEVRYERFFGTEPMSLTSYGKTVWYPFDHLGPFTSNLGVALDSGQTYYWKIIAEDNHGATSESPVWEFTTEEESECEVTAEIAPVPPVSGLTIEGNATSTCSCLNPCTGVQIYVFYNDGSSARYYNKTENEWQVGQVVWNNVNVLSGGCPDNPLEWDFTIDTELNSGMTYYTRVKATDELGYSGQSFQKEFYVNEGIY